MTPQQELEWVEYRIRIMECGNDSLFTSGPAVREEYLELLRRRDELREVLTTKEED